MSIYKMMNKRMIQFQEMVLRKKKVFGSPFSLVMETGNICNLRCPLCATTNREPEIPRGMTTFENAKKIIDQFPALVHINMSLWGEPFLNREIFDIIAYAQKKGIKVMIQSNLNKFDKDMAEKLILSELDHLMISLDGASQETYQRYRVGGNFSKVISHIRLLRDIQKEQNNYNTAITWKMVVNKFNEYEVDKARNWADQFGINFRTVEIYTPQCLEDQWKPSRKLGKNENVYTNAVTLCHSLWQTMVVNFNGDVFPCCSEWSPKDAMGNIFKEPVGEIWNNVRYRTLRRLNKKSLNCEACHTDKETNWYKMWRQGILPDRFSNETRI